MANSLVVIRRISSKEIRNSADPGRIQEAPPIGIAPVLRSSWRFAQNMAERFNRELTQDRLKDLLKKLAKRFV